ncbi:MAG: efflux RND transporter periplasmic adaptor subunit [Myxococcales bacterium]
MTRLESQADPEVVKTLGSAKPPNRWRGLLIWSVLGVLVLGGGGLGISRFLKQRAEAQKPHYESAAVQRRDIQVVISATGTLKGLNTVEVGAEVSGRITRVAVDFNDPVKKGQVLAEIDPEQLHAAFDEAKAQLAASQASIAQARATLLESEQSAARAEQQSKQGLVSQRELEAAIAARERARAALESSQASTTVASATLKSTKSKLEKTQVLSPIDGIVLSRLVEPGQTLTAGFTTPVLFKLAEDLRQMSLYVYIDEADIGRAREGQAASFAVDAYPERSFPSKVMSLRNEPKEDQNVVSYEAVLSVDNAELLLRPGMTATATIVANERKNALAIPNAALRFTPPNQPPEVTRVEAGQRRVWVLQGDAPAARSVKTGASDGQYSELLGGDLKEGDQVLTDVVEVKRERP